MIFENVPLKPFIIVGVICCVLIILIFVLVLIDRYFKRKKNSLDSDTVVEAIAKLQLSISKATKSPETLNILLALRKKLHNNDDALIDAMKYGLTNYIIDCIEMSSLDDKIIPAGIDVLNEMWSCPKAKYWAQNNRDFSFSHIEKFIKLFSLWHEEASQPIVSVVDDEADEVLIKDHNKSPFISYQYKLIMTLGLIASDSSVMQNFIGDKDGMKVIIDIFNGTDDVKILKWCFWGLVHLTLNNPANKAEIVQRNFLSSIVTTLSIHVKNIDLINQGLPLIFNIISDDDRAKMNLSKTRQAVMNYGIVDVIQSIQNTYRSNVDLQRLCRCILDILAKEYS